MEVRRKVDDATVEFDLFECGDLFFCEYGLMVKTPEYRGFNAVKLTDGDHYYFKPKSRVYTVSYKTLEYTIDRG